MRRTPGPVRPRTKSHRAHNGGTARAPDCRSNPMERAASKACPALVRTVACIPAGCRIWLVLIGGATDPTRPHMTRLIRSAALALVLLTATLGGWSFTSSEASAVPAQGAVGVPLPPGWSSACSRESAHRRPRATSPSRRMASRRRRIHQQHRGLQPVQHAPDDRRQRRPTGRGGLGQRVPRLCHMGRWLCGDGGERCSSRTCGPLPLRYARECGITGGVPRRRRPERVVRTLGGRVPCYESRIRA